MMNAGQKIRILSLLFPFFISHYIYSQPIYQQEYGFGAEQPVAIERLGQAYYVAGTTGAPGSGLDACIMKIDGSGAPVWTKAFGGILDEQFYAIVRTQDGMLAAVGTTWSYIQAPLQPGNVYVVIVDTLGAVHRSKSIGTVERDAGYSIQQTADGGFVIAGTTDSAGVPYPYLVKTDAQLNVQWTRVFTNTAYSEAEAKAVVQTSGGGYALTGYARPVNAPGEQHLFIMLTDASGQPTLVRHFSASQSGYTDNRVRGHDLVQNAAGNLVIVGTVGGYYTAAVQDIFQPLLLELDLSGNVILSQSYFLNSGICRAASVRQTPDGGYILGGTMGNDYLAMLKTDQFANTQWCYHYDNNFNPRGSGYSARYTPGGGYILAGSLQLSSTVRIVRTDAQGNSGCEQATPIGGGGVGSPIALIAASQAWSSYAKGDTAPAPTTPEPEIISSVPICNVVAVTPALVQRVMSLHPNPARDRVVVETRGAEQLTVLNVLGQVFHTQPLEPTGLSQTTLDIAAWPAGVYLIRAGEETRKLIKE